MRSINLIPYVCSAGGQTVGSEQAGIDLQKAGLLQELEKAGLPVKWQADPQAIYDMPYGRAAHEHLPALGTPERKDIVLWHCRHLQQEVIKALGEGALPLTLGGDHAMALGSISGLARAKNAYGRTGVLWIDAHPDFNTPETSPSQALHGMPLAALCGIGDPDFVALAGDRPVVDPAHIVYVGIRDIDPGEREYINELGITAFTMADIDRLGIEEVLRQAEAVIGKNTVAKAISIDLDGFDPEDVPATGTPVAQGLKPDETLPALGRFMTVAGFDLVEITEYNPTLPGREPTRAFIRRLLETILPNVEASRKSA